MRTTYWAMPLLACSSISLLTSADSNWSFIQPNLLQSGLANPTANFDSAPGASFTYNAPAGGTATVSADAAFLVNLRTPQVSSKPKDPNVPYGLFWDSNQLDLGGEIHRNDGKTGGKFTDLAYIGGRGLAGYNNDLELYPDLSVGAVDDHLNHATGPFAVLDVPIIHESYKDYLFNDGKICPILLLPRIGVETEDLVNNKDVRSRVVRGYGAIAIAIFPEFNDFAKQFALNASGIEFNDIEQHGAFIEGSSRSYYLMTINLSYSLATNVPAKGANPAFTVKIEYLNGVDPVFIRQPKGHFWNFALTGKF